MTPEDVVRRQLDAYNSHDLEGFLACYGEAASIFRLPAPDPQLIGKTQLREAYGTRFRIPTLRAEILNRMTLGNKVVDHERVHGLADTPVEVVAVYEVLEDAIQRVWFHYPS